MGEARKEAFRVGFDSQIKLEFHGAMAEVMVPRKLFAAILDRIQRLRTTASMVLS